METYTLFDLNEYIKRVISLNFQEPIWISCEIAQCKNNRGHYYLELVQQDENEEVIAQASAVLWSKNHYYLKTKLKDLLNSLLEVGVQIKIKVKVEYNEKFGLKYVIEDIDPTFTFGQLELNRQKILDKLNELDLIEKNKMIHRPTVIKKIAVISSEEAAGYADFKKKLAQNIYGYTFNITLYKAAMQGTNTEKEVLAALKVINEKPEFDAIVLIRGGGSKLDLAAFDNYEIAKAIALSQLPVFTGIGHDIDTSIADIVANKSFITPTAVADFLIEQSMLFEGKVNDYHQTILGLSQYHINENKNTLKGLDVYLQNGPKNIIKQNYYDLQLAVESINRQKNFIILNQKEYLKNLSTTLQLIDPINILKKGFVLVTNKEGKFITSSVMFDKSQVHELEFHDGKISSK